MAPYSPGGVALVSALTIVGLPVGVTLIEARWSRCWASEK